MNQAIKINTLVGLLLSACTGSDGVGIEVRAVSTGPASQSELVFSDDGQSDYIVQTASLRLRHIELDLPDGSDCSDIADALDGAECNDSVSDDKIRIQGPFDVNLVSGVATPSLADVVIPEGTYKRVDFRVEDNSDDVSFAVTAGFTHNGDAMTLELSLDFNEDIRIETPTGISVDGETDLIAEFVVGSWLAGVDVGKCIDDDDVHTSGTTVTIDDNSTSGSCSDIENTIKDNMKHSGQLDRD